MRPATREPPTDDRIGSKAASGAGPRRPCRPTRLAADLRASLAGASIALLLAALALGALVLRVQAGADAAALEMPGMVRSGGIWTYSASQAIGWSALLWSWLTIQLGLTLPICGPRRRRLRAALEALHRSMSLTLVALMLAHALLLLWDKMGDTLVSDFVPWTTSYLPGRFPQALGIVSFYLAALLGLSFYVRDRMGPGVWRTLHQFFVPAVYGFAVWHAFAYGSDVKAHSPVFLALWVMQAPLVALYAWRLWRGARGGGT